MFPAQYLFADTGRSVHRNEKIVWKHYYFYSMNNYKQKIYLRIMYTNKMILLIIFCKSSKYVQIYTLKKIFLWNIDSYPFTSISTNIDHLKTTWREVWCILLMWRPPPNRQIFYVIDKIPTNCTFIQFISTCMAHVLLLYFWGSDRVTHVEDNVYVVS